MSQGPADAWTAPAEFISYVERRLRPLEEAGRRLTGDDVQSDRIAREMLCLVAVRWGRLRRADARHGDLAGTAADGYLAVLYQDQVAEFGGHDRIRLELDAAVPSRRRSASSGMLRPVDEASLIWDRARAIIRRRLLVAAGIGGFALLVALCRPGGDRSESLSGLTSRM